MPRVRLPLTYCSEHKPQGYVKLGRGFAYLIFWVQSLQISTPQIPCWDKCKPLRKASWSPRDHIQEGTRQWTDCK